MREEFLDPQESVDEVDDVGLRPRRLDDFVGQSELRDKLSIVLEAARRRHEAVDHLLFAALLGSEDDTVGDHRRGDGNSVARDIGACARTGR